MQHLITDQQLGEKNIFHSRTRKLINLQPMAKTKKRKSADRRKSGIPVILVLILMNANKLSSLFTLTHWISISGYTQIMKQEKHTEVE